MTAPCDCTSSSVAASPERAAILPLQVARAHQLQPARHTSSRSPTASRRAPSCPSAKRSTATRLVGIAEGIECARHRRRRVRLFVNHELLAGRRHRPRAWRHRGCFRSRTTRSMRPPSMVRKGADLDKLAWFWNDVEDAYEATHRRVTQTAAGSHRRTCPRSPPSEIPHSRTAYNGRIYMNDDELAKGRDFAHIVTGREHGTALGATRLRATTPGRTHCRRAAQARRPWWSAPTT